MPTESEKRKAIEALIEAIEEWGGPLDDEEKPALERGLREVIEDHFDAG